MLLDLSYVDDMALWDVVDFPLCGFYVETFMHDFIGD